MSGCIGFSEGKAENKEKVETITWAQGGTLGSGGCERVVTRAWAAMPVALGKPKAGLWVALAAEKDQGTCSLSYPLSFLQSLARRKACR